METGQWNSLKREETCQLILTSSIGVTERRSTRDPCDSKLDKRTVGSAKLFFIFVASSPDSLRFGVLQRSVDCARRTSKEARL